MDLLTVGIRHLLEGRPREAVEALRWHLRKAPFDGVAHFDLGVAERLLGHRSEALGHAKVAMEVLDRPEAEVLYGLHLQLAGRPDAARARFEAATHAAPEYGLAWMYLGLLEREAGRREAAMVLLERALRCALSRLVSERVQSQRFDLARGGACGGEVSLCAVAAVTEVLLPDGTLRELGFGPSGTRSVTGRAPAGRVRSANARSVSPEVVADTLHTARRVVALTGAGISAGSGLPTRKELWTRHDRDAAVSAVGRSHDPGALWNTIRDFLSQGRPQPNAAHDTLARIPRLHTIVTQNVDELHQRAALPGRQAAILELHGSIERLVCAGCGAPDTRSVHDLVLSHLVCPWCLWCSAALRPDVVLFGEHLGATDLKAAIEAVEACDVLLVVGCAMDVSPAAELPRLAAAAGARVIEVKPGPSRLSDAIGSEILEGLAEETLPRVYTQLAQLEEVPSLRARPPRSPPPTEPALRPVVTPGADSDWSLIELRKQPGERVEAGEVVAVLDQGKAVAEVESPVSGVLRRVGVSPAVPLLPGQAMVWIEAASEAGTPVAVGETPRQDPSHQRATVVPLPEQVPDPDRGWFVPLGPDHRRVRARIGALRQRRWLCGGELDVREAGRAHGEALGIGALTVWESADVGEVVERWSSAWKGVDHEADADERTLAWRSAWAAAEAPMGGWLGSQRAIDVAELVDPIGRIQELHPEAKLSSDTGEAGRAIEALSLRALGRTIHGLDDPFAPLLVVFEAGAWPFVLPGGVLGVYRPAQFPCPETWHEGERWWPSRAFPGLGAVPGAGYDLTDARLVARMRRRG